MARTALLKPIRDRHSDGELAEHYRNITGTLPEQLAEQLAEQQGRIFRQELLPHGVVMDALGRIKDVPHLIFRQQFRQGPGTAE